MCSATRGLDLASKRIPRAGRPSEHLEAGGRKILIRINDKPKAEMDAEHDAEKTKAKRIEG